MACSSDGNHLTVQVEGEMQRLPVSSSNVRSVGYERKARILEVEFVAGQVYQYHGVPERVFREIVQGPSAGKLFNMHVRNRYPYSRVS